MRNFLTSNLGAFNVIDDFFDGFFKPMNFSSDGGRIRADVRESQNEYELAIDLPGFDKKDISLTLEDGYLTVKAKKEQKEKDEKNYIRRERSCSVERSFFVGEQINEEDIKAKYNNGTLELNIPKLDKKQISKEIQID